MENKNKIAQDKLKLLYILNFIDIPLTNIEITNYILEYDLMDYFSLQQMLSDLCDVKFIALKIDNGSEYYIVSEAGKAALEMFSNLLPEYFKNEAESNFSHLKKNIKKQRELFGHFYKRENDQYILSLQVMENNIAIFNLSINVPTEQMARQIVEKWKTNPQNIFGQIMNTLTSDIDYTD